MASCLLRRFWFAEDRVDLGGQVEQFLAFGRVDRTVAPGRAGGLRCPVEQVMQLRVLLEVRRLEIVRPQHPQMMLDQLGPPRLDQQRPGPEHGSSLSRYFSMIALTDSASIRAWAGSYTPDGRSQCAHTVSTERNRRMATPPNVDVRSPEPGSA